MNRNRRRQREATTDSATERSNDYLDSPSTTTEMMLESTTLRESDMQNVTDFRESDEPVTGSVERGDSSDSSIDNNELGAGSVGNDEPEEVSVQNDEHNYNTIMQPIFGLPLLTNSTIPFHTDIYKPTPFTPHTPPLINNYGHSQHFNHIEEKIDLTTSYPSIEYREYEFIPSLPDIMKNFRDNNYFMPIIIPSLSGSSYQESLNHLQSNQYGSASSETSNNHPLHHHPHYFYHQQFFRYPNKIQF